MMSVRGIQSPPLSCQRPRGPWCAVHGFPASLSPMELPKTMVHALHEQAARLGHRPALWTRRGPDVRPASPGVEYAERVKRFALGLHALGFPAGGALGILSFNREEWLVGRPRRHGAGRRAGGHLHHQQRRADAVHPRPLARRSSSWWRTRAPGRRPSVRERLPKLRHIIVMDAPATLPEGVLRYADVAGAGHRRGRGALLGLAQRAEARGPGAPSSTPRAPRATPRA